MLWEGTGGGLSRGEVARGGGGGLTSYRDLPKLSHPVLSFGHEAVQGGIPRRCEPHCLGTPPPLLGFLT